MSSSDDDPTINIKQPKVLASMQIVIPGQPAINYTSDEVPVSIQDMYTRIIGDGKAKVAVTVDVGIKDFGTGVSSSCTVVLTCNQDQRTIQEAADLAGAFARDYAKENRERADMELQQLLVEKARLGR